MKQEPEEEFITEDASAPGNRYFTFAIAGQTGSGKTYSALLLARGLVGPDAPIGVIDTENGRCKTYWNDPKIGGFRRLDFKAPYSPTRFISAMKHGIKEGWKAIIIDNASSEHEGEGGICDMAEKEAERLFDKNPRNNAISMQKWTQPKMAHRRFLIASQSLPAHVIFLFRQTLTTDFETKPPTTHLTTVAEKNTLYEIQFHATLDPATHIPTWTRLEEPFKPFIPAGKLIDIDLGQRLAEIAKSGQHESARYSPPTTDDAREAHLQDISDYLDSEGITTDAFNAAIAATYRGKKTEYTNYTALPTDHLEVLSKADRLAAMADKAREIASA